MNLFIILLTPILVFILGYTLFFRYPSKINNFYGYRTKRSKASQESWVYAQKLSAKLFMIFSFISLVVSIYLYITNYIFTNIIFIQMLILSLSFIFIEVMLRIKFDENGNRKD